MYPSLAAVVSSIGFPLTSPAAKMCGVVVRIPASTSTALSSFTATPAAGRFSAPVFGVRPVATRSASASKRCCFPPTLAATIFRWSFNPWNGRFATRKYSSPTPKSLLLGTHPTFTHVPPIVPPSIISALAPFRSARIAALNAAAPPPRMTRSYRIAMNLPSCGLCLRPLITFGGPPVSQRPPRSRRHSRQRVHGLLQSRRHLLHRVRGLVRLQQHVCGQARLPLPLQRGPHRRVRRSPHLQQHVHGLQQRSLQLQQGPHPACSTCCNCSGSCTDRCGTRCTCSEARTACSGTCTGCDITRYNCSIMCADGSGTRYSRSEPRADRDGVCSNCSNSCTDRRGLCGNSPSTYDDHSRGRRDHRRRRRSRDGCNRDRPHSRADNGEEHRMRDGALLHCTGRQDGDDRSCRIRDR